MENYDQVIQNALAGVNPIINAPIPPLNTGTPLLPRSMVSDAVMRAMTPGGAPVTEDDKSNAIIKIGQGLMQPRMPGESTVGNIGKSIGGGIDYLDAAKARAQNTAAQQAGVGMQAMTSGAQANQMDAALQAMAAKFPMETAELQQKLKTLALEGKVAEYNALKAAIVSDPELVLRHAKADIAAKEAAGKQGEAHARYFDSLSAFYDRGGKDKIPPGKKTILHTTKSDDGSVITSYMNGEEGPFHDILRPGISDAQQAMKLAEKELKREKNYGWFQGPTPEQIKERATELMKPRLITIDAEGKTVDAAKKPEAAPPEPAAATPKPSPKAEPKSVDAANFPKETPDEARDAAKRSLAIKEKELESITDPAARQNLQKQIDQMRLASTSENVHATARAVRPSSVAKPKKEVWTPEKLDQMLNSPADKTGGQLDVEDAKAEYDSVIEEVKKMSKQPSRDPKVIVALKQKAAAARAKYLQALSANSTDPFSGESNMPE